MKKRAVIGLGNPMMSDEGIGVRVVAQLQDTDLVRNIDVIDLGTAGMNVLHELEGRERVIFVDCAMMDDPPGTIRRFTPDEVTTRKVQMGLSLHEGDLLNTLALARRLGICPEDVVIFGIEPRAIEYGDRLSLELEERLGEYTAAIRAEATRPDAG